jgi:hypothetical protein
VSDPSQCYEQPSGLNSATVPVVWKALLLALAAIGTASSGPNWRLETTPHLAASLDASLLAVSCWSDVGCVAVGLDNREAFSLSWNGHRWSRPTPLPGLHLQSDYGSGILACPAAGDCFVVGSHDLDGAVDHLSDGRWILGQVAGGPLSAIACADPSACLAVSSDTLPVEVQSWDGSSWRAGRAPAYLLPGGMSCPTATTCFLSGEVLRDGGEEDVVERDVNGRWSALAAPTHTLTLDVFTSIDCPTVSVCVMVGSTASQHNVPSVELAAVWSRDQWSVTSVAPRFEIGGAGLSGVSCPTPTSCTAVGSGDTSGTPSVLTWDGRTWKVSTTPSTGVYAGFNAVSCISHTCQAVGFVSHFPGDPESEVLAERTISVPTGPATG